MGWPGRHRATGTTPGSTRSRPSNRPVHPPIRAVKTGPGTAVIQADMRDPDTILNRGDTQRQIDLSRPLAILFAAVLHFIPDADQPHALVARFLDAAVPA